MLGGPIGLRLTSILARIVMDQWTRIFMDKMITGMVHLYALIKYVDDVNVVMRMLGLGWKWNEKVTSLEWTQDQEDLDKRSGLSPEHITMNIVKVAADSVFNWLEFTTDLPEDHTRGMVPFMDLQLWVQHDPEDKDGRQGPADVLTWRYYEKPTVSTRVIRATTAFDWRSIIVTLNPEVFRHLRNTSRQLTTKERVNILTSGVNLYYKKLRTDLEGGTPLNIRSTDNVVARRRAKMSATSIWFCKRKRGGVKERLKQAGSWRRAGMNGAHRNGSRGMTTPSRIDPNLNLNLNPNTIHHLGTTAKKDMTEEVEAVMMIPYTVGSGLQATMQNEVCWVCQCQESEICGERGV